MLTDRCATMCLLATLGTFYPRWLFFFQLSMTIDISCHWIYLHTTTLQGDSLQIDFLEFDQIRKSLNLDEFLLVLQKIAFFLIHFMKL